MRKRITIEDYNLECGMVESSELPQYFGTKIEDRYYFTFEENTSLLNKNLYGTVYRVIKYNKETGKTTGEQILDNSLRKVILTKLQRGEEE